MSSRAADPNATGIGTLAASALRSGSEPDGLDGLAVDRGIQAELRELHEHQLGLALEAAEMGIWRWEMRGNVVSWDRRMEAIFGLDEGEFDGQFDSYTSRLHPDDREATLARVRWAVENDSSYRVLHRVVWSDGSQHWVESVGRPLHNDHGVAGLIGVSVDVTQRKMIEDAANQLAAIVESTSDAVIGETLDGRITSWNPAAEKLFGYTADEAVGRMVTMLCPPGLVDELFAALNQVATGATVPHRETVRAHKDGTLIDVALSLSPVKGPLGDVVGASVIARDITERKRGEQAAKRRAARVERLNELTSVLARAETPDEVLDAVIDRLQPAADASAALIGVLSPDGNVIDVARAVGYPEELIDAWRSVPIDAGLPLADAVRRGVPLFQNAAEVLDGYPEASSIVRPSTAGLAVLPLQLENRILGVLGMSFGRDVSFEDDQRELLLDLANRCAVALSRAASFEREMAARARAEQVSERLSFLAEAGAALAASLDVETTVDTVTALAVPRLADWCAVTLSDPKGSVTARHPDPDLADAVVRLTTAALQAPRHGRPGWEDLSARRAVFWPQADPALLVADLEGEHRTMVEQLDVRSLIVVPIASRDKVVGALTLARSTPDNPYTAEDLQLAEELARRAATAIDNARLFGEQRHLAHTLQDNLLPRSLPVVPGLELGARYNAAGHGTEVGGDFYDAFELGGGRWAFAIGDVCGQGADAAGVTALARHTLRAITTSDQDPADILRRLNDLLLAQDIGRRFITVALAIVKVDEDGIELSFSQGGHPDPLVVRADGSIELMSESRGTVLGVLAEPTLRSASVRMHEGDGLILYTDGVTEARFEGEQFGVDRLCEVAVASAGADADRLAHNVVEASIAFGRAEVTPDDLAVFTARCTSR